MRVRRLLLVSLLGPLCFAQQTSPPASSAVPSSAYAAQREQALAPILEFIRHGDYAAASVAIRPLLDAYPHDLRVMFLAADAARISGDLQQALNLNQQCLELKTAYPGAIHLGLVRIYADMGRWEEFNRERALVRQMALDGDRTLSVERGYVVEDHRDGKLHIEVLEFPSTDPAAMTRFRFLFLPSRDTAARFTPSIDLEANPADLQSFARQYPSEAAAHTRPFALISYPDAHTRGFLKFYPEGEPPYEDIHADVLAVAQGFPEAAAPASGESHRPAYKPRSVPKP